MRTILAKRIFGSMRLDFEFEVMNSHKFWCATLHTCIQQVDSNYVTRNINYDKSRMTISFQRYLGLNIDKHLVLRNKETSSYTGGHPRNPYISYYRGRAENASSIENSPKHVMLANNLKLYWRVIKHSNVHRKQEKFQHSKEGSERLHWI